MSQSTNYTDSLAKIWVGQPGSGQDEVFGTAFPVSSRRLLTAGHLFDDFAEATRQQLEAEQNGDDGEPVLRIFVQFAPFGADHQVEGRLLWWGRIDSPDSPDAAVIECCVPEKYLTHWKCASQIPDGEWSWEAVGFSRVGRTAEAVTGVPLDPVTGSGSTWPAATVLPALSAMTPPKQVEQWKGASGCPVVRKSDNLLLGVQSRCDCESRSPAQLYFVPVWKLLAEPGFCAAVERNMAYQAAVTDAALNHAKDVLGRFDEPAVFELARKIELPAAKSVDEIAQAILDPSQQRSVVAGLTRLYSDAHANDRQVRWLAELIDAVLPVYLPPETLSAYSKQTADADCLIIVDTASTHEGAEVLMSTGGSAKPRRPGFRAVHIDGRKRFVGCASLRFQNIKVSGGDPNLLPLRMLCDLAADILPEVPDPASIASTYLGRELKALGEDLDNALREWPGMGRGRAYAAIRFRPDEPHVRAAVQQIAREVRELTFLELVPVRSQIAMYAFETRLFQWLGERHPEAKRI